VEPNWESGKNQWWRFKRADGQPWGMAGMWNTWTDQATGEIHESYTMVTLNADHHPLLRRMHRPDLTRPPQMQDKRAVVPLAPALFDVWLNGTIEEAAAALVLPEEALFDAGPDRAEPPAPQPEVQRSLV
jgi:putative SOS response-associated peptidase YedK